MYIKKSEVEKLGGSMSNDNITTENANSEAMEKIRTGYIRDTLTKIFSENSCIELNECDKRYIKDLSRTGHAFKNSDVLVELVKVLDSDGIQFFFEKCKEYLSQNNAPQKRRHYRTHWICC